MPPTFLNLAKSITLEVSAGRITPTEAKERLKINSTIIVDYHIQERCKLWECAIKRSGNIGYIKGEEKIYG